MFFLGILLAVGALQEAGHPDCHGRLAPGFLGDVYLINIAIGLLSAIVDNAPRGRFDGHVRGGGAGHGGCLDGLLRPGWHLLAVPRLLRGTGGSALIIGSAAGVAVMGLEKIDFVWYMKRMSLLAIAGYLAGAAVYWLMFGMGA